MDDRERELSAVLGYLVGRPVPAVELARALGVSRSSYYAARDERRLITAGNLIRLAGVFGLNAVDLLVRYGLISHDAAVDYLSGDARAATVPQTRSRSPRLDPRRDLPPL